MSQGVNESSFDCSRIYTDIVAVLDAVALRLVIHCEILSKQVSKSVLGLPEQNIYH